MNLIMFDIDGTLLTGNGIDDICFAKAVNDILGVQHFDTDWSHYSNVTETGITSEIIEKNLSRRAEERNIRAVRRLYSTKLKREIRREPHSFRPTPGALELITRLRSIDDVCMCIATGGWRDPALLKLRAAGISAENIPLASSDDSHERSSIMLKAYELSCRLMNCKAFTSVLYVADHVRDFANAEKLGYDFVGIGSGNSGQKLRDAGAIHVLPDLTDQDYLFRILGAMKD